jgi:histone H3/H4
MSDREFGGEHLATVKGRVPNKMLMKLQVTTTCRYPKVSLPPPCASRSIYLKMPFGTSRGRIYSIYYDNTITYAYTVPTATVQKIITEILPPTSGVTFAREARDLLIDCCVEFIRMLSSEANEISEKEARKTIAPEHIEKALKELDFEEYIPEILGVVEEFKEIAKVSRCWRKKKWRLGRANADACDCRLERRESTRWR